jgi:signal recognition particle subunit SRP54
MFADLGDNLSNIFAKIRKKGTITESDLTAALREIRVALLEADVALTVVRKITNAVKERALGEEIIDSVTPAQMVIKIVQDELTDVLQAENQALNLSSTPPVVFLLVGLQGIGKTTTAAKLALHLKQKYKKDVLLSSLDTQRPAAQEQLQTLAKQVEIDSVDIISGQRPTEIVRRTLEEAKSSVKDVVIFDTAGRLHTDEQLMQELQSVRDSAQPLETLLVVDIMSGQDVIKSTSEFNEKVGITGLILTRVDAETRGGAALSVKEITGCPIKFLGTGEKLADFEQFHPDRMASRILNMGDVVSLVEKAAEVIDEKASQDLAKKIKHGQFDMEDLRQQLKNMKKMGGMSSMLKLIPGLKGFSADKVDAKLLNRQEAIINSMTKQEREFPKILNASRKKRIAKGCCLGVEDVNKLLKQFLTMQKMMKKFGKFGNMPMSGLPNSIDKNFLKKML